MTAKLSHLTLAEKRRRNQRPSRSVVKIRRNGRTGARLRSGLMSHLGSTYAAGTAGRLRSPMRARMCARFCVVLGLAASLGLTTLAQNRASDSRPAYDPASAPGAGQRFLERFVGHWDVERIFHPRNGEAVIAKGECHQTLIHGGRFLQSEFVFHRGQTNITGTGLTGFEPASGLFTSVWADSHSTKMSIRQSKEPFDGEKIILFSAPLAGGVREERPSRDVTRLTDGGRKIIHQQFAVNVDQSERLMLELILTLKSQ